ncbi:MAG: rod shape-determining protein RodA [Spirochaetales bacterium]|nr:rod shape-determining protein RodA [Spirochaetales bacterium]MBR6061052.1 rod shape-determining protein RodA [Spirochaetales bacterium]
MNSKNFTSSFDYIIFLSTIALTVIGILYIYSANLIKPEISHNYIKQIIFGSVGLVMMITLLFVPSKSISDVAVWFYALCAFGLVVTLLFPEVKGQRRLYIFGINLQFSEFMKLATIILLAKYYASMPPEQLGDIMTYLKGGLIIALPAGLIMLQPDLGTTLVYIPIFLTISFLAGVPKRYVIYTIAFIGMVTFIPIVTSMNKMLFNDENEIILLLMNPKYMLIIFGTLILTVVIALLAYFGVIKGIDDRLRPVFYWYVFIVSVIVIAGSLSYPVNRFMLKPYQKDRLLIFLNPDYDPRGKGFHIIQSRNTIGNGGLLGRGWTKGDQTQHYFLPEQATDFIYAVIAEERGYLGSLIILLLYGLIFARGFIIMYRSRDYWGSYVVGGVIAMLLFHVLENMGMGLGIMPITGIPLPFLSYGGSFLMACFCGIGLVMNVSLNRYQF